MTDIQANPSNRQSDASAPELATVTGPREDGVIPASPGLPPIYEERQRLLAIMERTNRLAFIATLEEMVAACLALMVEISEAESAVYFQLDADANELVLTEVFGDDETRRLLGLRFKRQGGLLELSAPGATPTIVGDLVSDPRWLRLVNPQSAWRKNNMIGLPLEGGGSITGVIQIYNYGAAELDLLRLVGTRLAAEIHQRRQLLAAQQSNDRLTCLLDIVGQLSGTLDRRKLLHQVAEHTADLLDAERSTVFLVNPGSDEMLYQIAYQSDNSSAEAQALDPAQNPIRRKSDRRTGGSRDNPSTSRPGAFNLLSSSALTVPIFTSSDRQPALGQHQTLGGVMALNKRGASFQPEDAQLLSILAEQTSNFLEVVELYESAGELFLDVVRALVTAIDAKDPYTQGHSQRVSNYSVMIAEELGLSDTQVNDIRISSLLHDIGKIGIPDGILQKRGSLTPEEYRIVKEHTTTGANILRQVKMLDAVVPGILQHHEQLGGQGYPLGLAGDEISLMARIISVADAFDAMTSDRPYRKAIPTAQVVCHLQEKAGVVFDPDCVHAFIRRINVHSEVTQVN